MWFPDLAGRSGPRYRAIADCLGEDVAAGRLNPGTRLPTHRDLAYRLGVTVGTVSRAYAEAERRGLVSGEVGRGTYVRDQKRRPGPTEDIIRLAADASTVIDLAVNAAALGQECEAVAEALRAVAGHKQLAGLLDYQPHAGLPEHRAAGAAWLAQRGYPVDPDQIIVTHGGQHAMALLLQVLTRPGDTILVERLTYPGLKAAADLVGVRLAAVDLDADGLVPDALDQAARVTGAEIVYFMPTVHNPTTASMPEDRRLAIAEVARRNGLTLIEDDLYGFLEPDSPLPVANLAPERTCYLNGLAKSITPGLRVGYMVAPPVIAERMVGAIRATSWMAGPIGAEVGRQLIESGEADRIARHRREEARVRQGLARSILDGFDVESRAVAFHLWLKLPEPWRREEFAAELLRRGVRVTQADAFAVGRAPLTHAVRVCLCSTPERAELERGLQIIRETLTEPRQTLHPVV